MYGRSVGGRKGEIRFIDMARSLTMSASRRNFLHSAPILDPLEYANEIDAIFPHPWRSIQLVVADRAEADSSPTPIPLNNEFADKEPKTLKWHEYDQVYDRQNRTIISSYVHDRTYN